jgi:hypothetical protein
MPGWVDNRLGPAEQRIENLLRQAMDLYNQVANAAQTVRNASMSQSPSGGGGGGYYTAYPSAVIAAGSSASLAVTQWSGSTGTVIGTYTVYNNGSAPTVAGNGTSTFALMLTPDGSGNFGILTQCCS